MINREIFNTEIFALTINFNHKFDRPNETIDFYYNQLSNVYNLSDEDFSKSVNYLIGNSSMIYAKFPKVEDFLKGCGKAPEQLAEKAWTLMTVKWIPRYGRYSSLDVGSERRHMALYETVDVLGGWSNICEKSSLELGKLEKKFKDKFKEIYTTGNFKRENHLIGITEKRKQEFQMIKLSNGKNLIGNES